MSHVKVQLPILDYHNEYHILDVWELLGMHASTLTDSHTSVYASVCAN